MWRFTLFNPLAKVRSWFDQRQAERKAKDDADYLKGLEQKVDAAISLNRAQKRQLAHKVLEQPSSRHWRKGHVEHCTVVAAWREKVRVAKAIVSMPIQLCEPPAPKRRLFGLVRS